VGATTFAGPTSGPRISLILDTFNRADEDPIQSPWAGPLELADSEARLVDNALAAAATGSSGVSQSFYASQSFGPTSEVWALVSDKGGVGDYTGLWLRATRPGTDTISGYILQVTNAGDTNPDTWTVFKEERGQRTEVGALPATAVANGDAIGFGAGGLSPSGPGTVLLRAAVYVQSEKAWKLVGDGVIDRDPIPALRTAGLVGVELKEGSATRVDVFGGGTVDPGPAPVGPGRTGILDRFDGADEDPIGGSWAGPIRPGNRENRTILHMLASSITGFRPSESYLASDSFGPASEVWAGILRKGSDVAFLDLWLRVQNPNTSNVTGYLLDVSFEDAEDTWTVYAFSGGTERTLGTLPATEVAAFDGVAFVADGSTLIGYHYTRAEGSWVEVGRVTDPAPSADLNRAGHVGIGLASPLSLTRIGVVGGGTIQQGAAMNPAQRRLLGRGGRLT